MHSFKTSLGIYSLGVYSLGVYSLAVYSMGADSLGVIVPQTVAHEQAEINKNTDSFARRHSQIPNVDILACFTS